MKKIIYIFLVSIAIVSFGSCYTNPDPGTGVIIVLDANDFRVPAAYVRLSQPGQTGAGIIINEGFTGNDGEYAYSHTDPENGMALEVILNIYAEKDGKVGQGIIRIKPEETSTETVHIF